jgi:Ca2+-binding RTX toxin-like protein
MKQITVSIPAFGSPQGPVSLEPNQTKTIAPGAYGAMSVKSGARLILQPGDYQFTQVSLETGSKLEVDSFCEATRIFVQTSFTFRGAVVEKAGSPVGSAVAFVYTGTQMAPIEAPFQGEIIAPNAEVTFNSQQHTARVIAKKIRVQPDAVIMARAGALFSATCQETPATTVPRCLDGLCCPDGGVQGQVGTCGEASAAMSCVYGTGGDEVLTSSGWGHAESGHLALFGGGGDDVVRVRDGNVLVAAGPGNDAVCATGTPGSQLVGGDGNDHIRATAASFAYPGAGKDVIHLGGGDDFILVADICEIVPGEEWHDSGGLNTVFAPVSREELEAAGLTLFGSFNVQTLPGTGCYATCGGHIGCPLSNQCGESTEGDEICTGDLLRGALGLPEWHSSAYEGVDPGLRSLLLEFLAASSADATAALEALRARRDEIRQVVLAELARTEARAFFWREQQVRVLAVLGGDATVPHLRDVAIAPVVSVIPDVSHEMVTDAEREGSIRRLAVRGLAAMTLVGIRSADAALEQVIRDAPSASGARDEAVLRYRLLGEGTERMAHLRSLLPADEQYLADLQMIAVNEQDIPSPPSMQGGTP